MSRGICRLCDLETELIRAHIIPDWAFRFLKQDGYFFLVNSEVKSRKLQTGLWDSNILCGTCDNHIIGKYDTYAKEYLNQDFQIQHIKDEIINGRQLTHSYIYQDNFDYNKLVLFIVSVLWRASISNREEFKMVDLGPYKNIAKESLMAGKVLFGDAFQIILTKWFPPKDGFPYEKAIVAPTKRRIGEAICYSLILSGFEAIIKVGKATSPLHMAGLRVDPAGFNILMTEFNESTIGKFTAVIKRKHQGRLNQS